MPNLPAATVSVTEQLNPAASGPGMLAVLFCAPQNSTDLPTVYTSTAAMLARFSYCKGVSYCASHFNDANTPVLAVPMAIATAGAVTTQNNTGVTGTSNVSAAASASGITEQVAGVFQVTQGTNVGTDQIRGNLSLDGGITYNPVRIGTATSYVIPNVGVTLSFGTGTLNVGDVFTFATSAPTWGSAGITAALAALQAQQINTRTWLLPDDCNSLSLANNVLTAANTYASSNQRFTCARVQVSDWQPVPTKAQTQISMQGGSALTFAAAGHTITRTTGSWITDGFVNGQMIKVAGATNAGNNGVFGPITVTSATVLTLSAGLVNEGPDPVGAVTVTASDQLAFAATTITRTVGSWLTEGFNVGDTVAITGATAGGNNTTAAITTLTATVLTASAATFTVESDYSAAVSVTKVQTDAGFTTAQGLVYQSIDASPAINLGIGRARKQDPITGYTFRRPAQWAASIREYQHDLAIPTYRKFDGPLVGFTLTDSNGNTVEHDEYRSGGALAYRFTCLRSYPNGPLGAYVALDLTRDTDNAFLSRMQNKEVTNEALRIVQRETENAIGTVLVLNTNGTATADSLQQLQERVNSALQDGLLQLNCPGAPKAGEGPRASSAVWIANTTDNLSNPGATLNGNLALLLNGTLENIATAVNVT